MSKSFYFLLLIVHMLHILFYHYQIFARVHHLWSIFAIAMAASVLPNQAIEIRIKYGFVQKPDS